MIGAIANGENLGSVRGKINSLIRAIRATGPELAADSTLIYSAGNNQVQAGDLLMTLAGGFGYQVAASGASDHHMTTAGGVKLHALPDGEGFIDTEQLGWTDGQDVSALLPQVITALPADGKLRVSGFFEVEAHSLQLPSDCELRARVPRVHGFNRRMGSSQNGLFFTAQRCRIIGLRFRLTVDPANGIGGNRMFLDAAVNSTGILIENCDFAGRTGVHVRLRNNTQDWTVRNCRFENGAWMLVISGACHDGVVEGCYFTGGFTDQNGQSAGECIKTLRSGPTGPQRVRVTNCTFVNTTRDAIDTTGGSPYWIIENNNFWQSGIDLKSPWELPNRPFSDEAKASEVVLSNNSFYRCNVILVTNYRPGYDDPFPSIEDNDRYCTQNIISTGNKFYGPPEMNNGDAFYMKGSANLFSTGDVFINMRPLRADQEHFGHYSKRVSITEATWIVPPGEGNGMQGLNIDDLTLHFKFLHLRARDSNFSAIILEGGKRGVISGTVLYEGHSSGNPIVWLVENRGASKLVIRDLQFRNAAESAEANTAILGMTGTRSRSEIMIHNCDIDGVQDIARFFAANTPGSWLEFDALRLTNVTRMVRFPGTSGDFDQVHARQIRALPPGSVAGATGVVPPNTSLGGGSFL